MKRERYSQVSGKTLGPCPPEAGEGKRLVNAKRWGENTINSGINRDRNTKRDRELDRERNGWTCGEHTDYVC